MGTDVVPTASVTELCFANQTFHVIATFCLFDIHRAFLAWTLLHESLLDQKFEFFFSLLLLNVSAFMAKAERHFAKPTYFKVAFVAPKTVLVKRTDTPTLWFDAVLYVGFGTNNSI